jgi:hypothetical protein
VPKHFGHSKVRKSKPGLSGSTSRNAIVSPHFAQRGLLITFTNTAYPPIKQLHHWTRFAQILCSEGDGCLEKCWTPAQQSRTSFLENQICTMLPASELNRLQKVSGAYCKLGETFFMRSKLAISALVVASLFGSTLMASAQTQPAPGASSEGNVGPGAASGKKTKHEKGMTTGSSTRSGAKKGDGAKPSDQDDTGSGADTMAAPKSGSKY